ncbi:MULTISPECIES: helix-turn-helix domain-containing protein [unclassified Sphingomonas]|uniref:helix-turn-helix domain-containing protein n=1 Tax=unclassified Sphingomonas TaxID=196159 RepID=UPI00215141F4|nr:MULTISPECIES: helix-turn-helix domain-containing protein [unclassified Sphingomonas]MCR5872246.1 helix-turn-helix domain-containing protein [Sphingomonas sp. J344]UUX99447.1 helix-turn-helix domain-containing protein [Sphingomonas sp. J315]
MPPLLELPRTTSNTVEQVAVSEVKMEPVTCSVNDAARAIGLSRGTLYKLMGQGKVDSIRVGGRRLIKVASVRKLVEAA